jgi:hypothetical protein
MTVHLPALGWLVAGALILFGGIGLLGAIRSGRRAETSAQTQAPVMAEAGVRTPGDLPPELHADIVRELLDDPAGRFTREHPAATQSPAPEPPAPKPPTVTDQRKQPDQI